MNDDNDQEPVLWRTGQMDDYGNALSEVRQFTLTDTLVLWELAMNPYGGPGMWSNWPIDISIP